MITVGCDACGKIRHVKDEHAGKKAKCPCGALLLVPNASAGHAGQPPAASVAVVPSGVPVSKSRTVSIASPAKGGRLWPIALAAVTLLIVAGAGVAIMTRTSVGHRAVAFDGADDLFAHPELLRDQSKSAADFSLKGVRLGDDRTKVVALLGNTRDDGSDLLGTDGGYNFRLRDGHVVGMVIANTEWLKRAGVSTMAEATQVLGAPTVIQHSAIWNQLHEMAASGHQAEPPEDVLQRLIYRTRRITILSGHNAFVELSSETPGLKDLSEYAASCESYVSALRSLNTRAEVGFNLAEFSQAVQDIAEKHAKLPPFPREWAVAGSFGKMANLAYEGDVYALRGWTGTFAKSQFKDAMTGNRMAIDAFDRMKSER